MNVATVDQKNIFFEGRNFEDILFFFFNGKIVITKIDMRRAITPPNLFGIDRRIAYANKKYHSGWIWIGVLNGFAGLKFSGSPIELGNKNEINRSKEMYTIIPNKSLCTKKGWNGILSIFGFKPVGLFDPFKWSDIKWIKIAADRINGSKKCSIKKRFNVAPLTENPPHNHSTIIFPIKGIADTKFVITVAPQKDICPQGKTYPMKAVPIRIRRIAVPDNHVGLDLKEENNIPRLIWI